MQIDIRFVWSNNLKLVYDLLEEKNYLFGAKNFLLKYIKIYGIVSPLAFLSSNWPFSSIL